MMRRATCPSSSHFLFRLLVLAGFFCVHLHLQGNFIKNKENELIVGKTSTLLTFSPPSRLLLLHAVLFLVTFSHPAWNYKNVHCF